MQIDQLKANIIVTGSIFPEPVEILLVMTMGESVKLIGKGLKSNQVYEPILNAGQLAQLQATPDKQAFDGNSLHFRLGVEALRLGLAYEYDPFFALAIANKLITQAKNLEQREIESKLVKLKLDLIPIAAGEAGVSTERVNICKPALADDSGLPNRDRAEQTLVEQELNHFLAEKRMQRQKEVEIISQHLEISLNTIIDQVQCHFAELMEQKESGSKEAGLDGRIKQLEDRLFELNARLEQRREELQQEGSCTITDIRHHGCAWVLPHPERTSPEIAPIISNEEIERIAVEAVIAREEARGWKVVSVEKENRGFDLISRQPHPEDPETAIGVRFIEVKGRSTIGEVALMANEYKTADRLKQDYWLYVVFNCTSTPEVHPIKDPVRLGWEPLVKIEHYHVSAQKILTAEQ